ncbi:hypothetical protein C2W62_26075 [Candidatus Entotheonella serta]|nr:hypothetical protein C2W62_26075 [Candidatus Entotheonella serta]
MAVIVKYVVVRDGKEDMIFTTKKEADAYDKMLDIAEQLHGFLQTSEIDIEPEQLDDLTFFMAQHRDQIGSILKGAAPDTAKRARAPKDSAPKPELNDNMDLTVAEAIEQDADSSTTSQPAKSPAKSKVAA